MKKLYLALNLLLSYKFLSAQLLFQAYDFHDNKFFLYNDNTPSGIYHTNNHFTSDYQLLILDIKQYHNDLKATQEKNSVTNSRDVIKNLTSSTTSRKTAILEFSTLKNNPLGINSAISKLENPYLITLDGDSIPLIEEKEIEKSSPINIKYNQNELSIELEIENIEINSENLNLDLFDLNGNQIGAWNFRLTPESNNFKRILYTGHLPKGIYLAYASENRKIHKGKMYVNNF